MLPALIVTIIGAIGVVMILSAVSMLAGFAWALLLAGAFVVAGAVLLRQGMIGNG